MEVIRIDVFQEGNATAIASVANPSKYQPVNIELPGTISGEQSLIIRSVLENQSIVDAPPASVLLDQHVVMPIPEASSYLTAPGADYATVKFVLTYTYTGSLSNDIKLRIYKNDGTLLKDNIYGSKTSNNVFDFITNVNVTDQVTTVYAKAVDVYGDVSDASSNVTIIASTAASFITEWVTSTANEVITLPIYNTTGTYNYTVEWGDGQSNTYTTNGLQTHTYATAGTYQISISGSLPGWSFTSGATGAGVSKTKITKIIQWGYIGVTYAADAFRGCANLNEIVDVCTWTSATSFSSVFYGCSALTTIGDNLFSGCTAVTDFYQVFSGCSALTTIPSGLFSGCTKVTDFSFAFYGCSALRTIGDNVFSGCTKVTNFSYAFRNCTALTTIPSGLFSGCTAVTNFGNAFKGCSALTAIPSGLFSGCTSATSFSTTFSGCSALTTIGDNVFSGCTAAMDFSNAFSGCSALTTIGDNVFSGCTSATSFSSAFDSCSALTTIGDNVFSGCTAATNFSYAFSSCSALTTIPSGLFSGCTSADSFPYAFFGCSKLTTIGDNVFSGCTSATSFSFAFGGCAKLTINPLMFGNCFDSNPRTVNVSSLFHRTSWTGSTAGTAPDLWNKTSFTWLLGTYKPFYGAGNSTTSITNYASIPSDWIS